MLLDCFGFGSVASVACAKYILAHKLSATSLHVLSGGGLSSNVETSKMAGGSYEDTMNSAPAAAKGASYSVEEVAKHAKKR